VADVSAVWMPTWRFRWYRESNPRIVSITLQQYWIEIGERHGGVASLSRLIRESRGEWRRVEIIDAPNSEAPT
jgi:hypothetical protein